MTEIAGELVPDHPLRYRRIGGGYRRDDVEQILADLQWALRGLEEDIDALRMKSSELEAELHEARAELEAYRAREDEVEKAVEAARSALERARRIEATVSERRRAVSAAVESLRKDLSRLERTVSEFEAPRASHPAPPDGVEQPAP